MKRRIASIIAVALGVMAASLLAYKMTRPEGPLYHGRPLGWWASKLSGPANVSTPIMREIQQMGTNGVRLIIRLDRYRPRWTTYRRYEIRMVQWLNQGRKQPITLAADRFQHNLFTLEIELSRQLGPQAIPQLIQLLIEDEGGAAREPLVFIGAPSIPWLSNLLTNANSKIRQGAIDVLMNFLDRNGVSGRLVEPALVGCLGDPIASIRCMVALNLAQRKQTRDQAIPVLLELLKSSDQQLRYQAAMGLAQIPSACDLAVPVLIEGLNNRDAKVRRNARYALSNTVPASKAGMNLGAWLTKKYE